MKLINVVKNLNSFNQEALIYAKEPWSELSDVVVLDDSLMDESSVFFKQTIWCIFLKFF